LAIRLKYIFFQFRRKSVCKSEHKQQSRHESRDDLKAKRSISLCIGATECESGIYQFKSKLWIWFFKFLVLNICSCEKNYSKAISIHLKHCIVVIMYIYSVTMMKLAKCTEMETDIQTLKYSKLSATV
jgi:hypothetical protein